jgi:hypothetical protein
MTEAKKSTGATGLHANGQHPAKNHAADRQGKQPGVVAEVPRRRAVNSGNPRITVAFPLSRIDIHEPSEELRDLAAMVEELAEEVATLAREVAPGQVEATDRLAAQAALIARRVGPRS